MTPTLQMKEAFLKRRDIVTTLLSEIPGIQCNHPDGAFYVFPNIKGLFGKSNGMYTIKNSDDFAELILQEAHVAIVAGSAFWRR